LARQEAHFSIKLLKINHTPNATDGDDQPDSGVSGNIVLIVFVSVAVDDAAAVVAVDAVVVGGFEIDVKLVVVEMTAGNRYDRNNPVDYQRRFQIAPFAIHQM